MEICFRHNPSDLHKNLTGTISVSASVHLLLQAGHQLARADTLFLNTELRVDIPLSLLLHRGGPVGTWSNLCLPQLDCIDFVC